MTTRRLALRPLCAPLRARSATRMSSNASAPSAPGRRRPALLLLGDSITEQGSDPSIGGWVCRLQYRYVRSVDVVARGLYGYNTDYFVRRALPGLIEDLGSWLAQPALVTLWLGANDAALLTGDSAALHVPLEQYRANLREIVTAIRAQAPTTEFLLIAPPAVNDEMLLSLSSTDKLNFSNAGTAEYARACVQEAAALGVPSLDLHSVFNALGVQQRNACLSDGIHLTTKGNALAFDEIQASIEREFPALAERLETWEHPDYLRLMAADDLEGKLR